MSPSRLSFTKWTANRKWCPTKLQDSQIKLQTYNKHTTTQLIQYVLIQLIPMPSSINQSIHLSF